MENKKKINIILGIVIIVQTIIFIVTGANKSYYHMDEAYSLGLASYERTEIQDNNDFYNVWHNGKYYEDYLEVDQDEITEFSQVYENQKNDVHPPLYYLLLRVFMGFSIGEFSRWPGIILNIIIFAFITIFMYLILEKILNNKEKAIIFSFVSAITMASLTNVIYIRMYALSTLNILIITYLHMKLLDKSQLNIKLLILVGMSALIGSLTHYYFLFYLAMLFLIFAIKYIKEKRIKELFAYIGSMCCAGIISLVIFPYSINHMFFGYRGQGVISKLTNINEFSKSIFSYILKINRFVFNNSLMIIISLVVLICIYKIIKKQKIAIEKNRYINIIILPTVFYFFLVAVSAPWIELRYIMPITQLIFVIIMYYVYELLKNIFLEKDVNKIIIAILAIILIMPMITKIEPEVMYSSKKNIVNTVSEKHNVPAIYFLDMEHNRFLDDIYLFSILDNSYITNNQEYTIKNIKEILQYQDLSNGLFVFINEGQDNDQILENVVNGINANECEWIERLNNSDVYYIK